MTGLKSITCATDVSDLLVDDARVFHQKAGVVRAEQERREQAVGPQGLAPDEEGSARQGRREVPSSEEGAAGRHAGVPLLA